jgi:squalene-hopene/tetraprenyl-beta-curcumene cyclase
VTPTQRHSIIDAIFAKQRDDGGWSMSTLASWTRADGTPQDSASDGYATGLVVLALERAGMASSEPKIHRGLDWLLRHQDPSTGAWFATSLNKKRDPSSDVGKFMIDAATAYAVLALTGAR